MALTLYTQPGAFRAFKILIAAEYNGVAVNVPQFSAADASSPEFLAKNPLGKLPLLETSAGQTVFESNAIARYVARLRRDTELYGVSFFESAQIDSWIDFSAHEIELPATVWYYPVVGYLPANEAATAKAQADLAKALGVLENHLVTKTYLVGNKVTLADITVASALVYPFKLVCGEEFRAQFPCVMRWFNTLVHQPAFVNVIGEVTLCASGASAAAGASAGNASGGKKQKQKKAKKAKGGNAAPASAPAPAPAAAPVQKKKPKHPLAILDQESPSPMSMDTWKKTYSNCGGDYSGAVNQFWEMFDAAGYSVFHATYNYNEDLNRAFMACNAVGGYLQRTDEIRRWTFGVHCVTGVEGEGLFLSAVYVIRGTNEQPMLDANPDAEYYTWTKLDSTNDEHKQLVHDYFTADAELHGKPVVDAKVFK